MFSIRKTKEDFIKDAKKIHGDKYDYSLVEYKSNKIKVKIICKKHGIFEQLPKDHISKKYGCSKCSKKSKLNNNEFIEKAKKIHGDRYDYSLVDYKNNHTPVKIICKEHGVFVQRPDKHTNVKHGCPKCQKNGIKLSNDDFIKRAKEKHSNRYDYSLVDYKNIKTSIKIICKKHGIFEQSPKSHLSASIGCPYCAKNKYKIHEQHLYILFDKKYKLYKIGTSINVKRRCREINSKYYREDKNIIIVSIFEYAGEYEKTLHKKYKYKNKKHPTYNKYIRSEGRCEWFKLNKSDLKNIIKIIKNEKNTKTSE